MWMLRPVNRAGSQPAGAETSYWRTSAVEADSGTYLIGRYSCSKLPDKLESERRLGLPPVVRWVLAQVSGKRSMDRYDDRP